MGLSRKPNICVSIHIWTKGEVGAVKPSSEYFTDRSKAVLLLWIFLLVMLHVDVCCPSCLFLASLWSPAGKGLTSWLSCMLCFLVFCHFPKFVLVHIRIKGEVGAVKLVLAQQYNIFTDRSKAVLLLWIICVSLCLVFFMLSHLFIAALWSPAGKGLTSWLLLVMFNYFFLSLSHLVSWVRCGT